MRVLLPLYSQVVPSVPNGTTLLYAEESKANRTLASLKDAGFRQISIHIENDGPGTLQFYARRSPDESYTLQQAVPVAAFSDTNPNVFTFDLTAYADVEVTWLNGADAQGDWKVTIEVLSGDDCVAFTNGSSVAAGGKTAWPLFTEGVMEDTDVLTSPWIRLNTAQASIQLDWSGTPEGSFLIQATNDLALTPVDITADFFPSIEHPAGAAGVQLLRMADVDFLYVQVIYTNASSDGLLNGVLVQ